MFVLFLAKELQFGKTMPRQTEIKKGISQEIKQMFT